MIKIEINDIDKVKEAHFNGLKALILPRAQLFLLAFKFIDGQATVSDLENFSSDPRTKTSLLRLLVRRKSYLNSQSDYFALSHSTRVKVHYYNQRLHYIALFSQLSIEANLRNLILADIDQLVHQDTMFTQAWFEPMTFKLINKIIDYDKFNKKKTLPYNAYSLAESLQVSVCPYCNRIYTSTIVTEDGEKIVKPTFDHFFSQSRHPFLALSFYNLIPSCNNCNSYLKGNIPFELTTHVHPYREGFEKDAVFDFLFKKYEAEKSHPGNYQVLINENPHSLRAARLSGNINDFKLREIYKSHADVVGEIVVKTDKESPYYALSLFKSLPSLPASKKEFYKFYFSNYFDEKDFNRRPLAKLTKDIVSKYLSDLTDIK